MGEWIELTDTLNFSGLVEASQNMVMPKARVNAVMIYAKYKVTDAGISAGENFDGCISEMRIGQGSAEFFKVKRNELSTLIDFINPGISDGAYSDDQPTTATFQDAFFIVPGPFRFQDVSDPRFYLTLRDITDEFGGASAFEATIRMFVDIADEPNGPGVLYQRHSFASDSKHKLPTPQKPLVDLITGLHVVLGASNLDDITYGRNDMNGNQLFGDEAIDFDNPVVGKMHYAAFKETKYSTASALHRYLFGAFENTPGDNDIVLDCSVTGATSCTAWVQGLKLATEAK